MIILEGPDCVGKTTAANALAGMMARHLGGAPQAYYRHMSRPPADFDHAVEYRKVTARVQDRWHLGSLAYGVCLGNDQNALTAPEFASVVRYLRWYGCLTIVMHASRSWLEIALRDDAARGQMYRLENILTVNSCYRALVHTSICGEDVVDLGYNVSTRGYPDEATLEAWFETWRRRWERTVE